MLRVRIGLSTSRRKAHKASWMFNKMNYKRHGTYRWAHNTDVSRPRTPTNSGGGDTSHKPAAASA